MTGYLANIEELTLANTNFRQVLYTGQHAQLVLMCLQINEEIGKEIHEDIDQFFRVEAGEGKILMNGEEQSITDGTAFIIPAGTVHNVVNTSSEKQLKFYTVYSPPHHREGVVHNTKAAAENDTIDHV